MIIHGNRVWEADEEVASFTGNVNTIVPCSPTTSNVDVTFPASPVRGDLFGFYVDTQTTSIGSFSAAPGYGVEPAASTLIHGSSYSGGLTGVDKWGLLMTGESAMFQYVDATHGWRCVHDGRYQTLALLVPLSDLTSSSPGSWTNVSLSGTAVIDTHNIKHSSGYASIKRAGKYKGRFSAAPYAAVSDQQYYRVGIGQSSTTPIASQPQQASETGSTLNIGATVSYQFSAGAFTGIYGMIKGEGSSVGADVSSSDGALTFLEVEEILTL